MSTDDKRLNETLAEVVMARPREFFIGEKRYCLWPPSLGKSMMIESRLLSLDIDSKLLHKNLFIESRRLAHVKKDAVCFILAIHSFKRFSDLCNTQVLRERTNIFKDNLSEDEIAHLFTLALNCTNVDNLIKLSGIEEERKERSRMIELREKNSKMKSFGGKTIFGALIDAACSKYGWTKEYVVWGIDLASLQLMLADSITSISLPDGEGQEDSSFGMSADDFARLRDLTDGN